VNAPLLFIVTKGTAVLLKENQSVPYYGNQLIMLAYYITGKKR